MTAAGVVAATVAVCVVALAAAWCTVAVHEAGHAVTALVLRVPVLAVQVGKGRPLWSVRIAGFRVTIRVGFSGSHTLYELPLTGAPALRHSLIAVAGPLANGVVAIGVVWVIAAGRVDGALAIALGAVALLNATMAIVNLVPVPGRGDPIGNGPGRRATDGWIVLSETLHLGSVRSRRQTALEQRRVVHDIRRDETPIRRGELVVEDNVRAVELQKQARLMAKEDPARGIELAREAIERSRSPRVRTGSEMVLVACLLRQPHAANLAEAEALAQPVLDDEGKPAAVRAGVAALMAWQAMTITSHPDPTTIELAETRARLAIDLIGDSVPTIGLTLALVLVRARRFDEAHRLAVQATTTGADAEASTRADIACVRALAAVGLGDDRDAHEQLEVAQLLDPDCSLLAETEAAVR